MSVNWSALPVRSTDDNDLRQDELRMGCGRPQDLLDDDGLMKKLKIRLMGRMLGPELTGRQGYEGGTFDMAGLR